MNRSMRVAVQRWTIGVVVGVALLSAGTVQAQTERPPRARSGRHDVGDRTSGCLLGSPKLEQVGNWSFWRGTIDGYR